MDTAERLLDPMLVVGAHIDLFASSTHNHSGCVIVGSPTQVRGLLRRVRLHSNKRYLFDLSIPVERHSTCGARCSALSEVRGAPILRQHRFFALSCKWVWLLKQWWFDGFYEINLTFKIAAQKNRHKIRFSIVSSSNATHAWTKTFSTSKIQNSSNYAIETFVGALSPSGEGKEVFAQILLKLSLFAEYKILLDPQNWIFEWHSFSSVGLYFPFTIEKHQTRHINW